MKYIYFFKMILKEIAQNFISQAEEGNVVLFISFLWDEIKDIMLCLCLVCVVYIGIYKIGCNIYAKKCKLKGYNPSNLIY